MLLVTLCEVLFFLFSFFNPNNLILRHLRVDIRILWTYLVSIFEGRKIGSLHRHHERSRRHRCVANSLPHHLSTYPWPPMSIRQWTITKNPMLKAERVINPNVDHATTIEGRIATRDNHLTHHSTTNLPELVPSPLAPPTTEKCTFTLFRSSTNSHHHTQQKIPRQPPKFIFSNPLPARILNSRFRESWKRRNFTSLPLKICNGQSGPSENIPP